MSIAIAQEFDTADVLAPEQPLTIEDSGLSRDSLTSLVVKSLHGGEASGMDLADRIRLPYGILEPLLEHLRVELLVQVKSAAGMGTAGYRYTLTDAGRNRALRYFEACGYVGPAPVPIGQYDAYMSAIRSQTRDVFRERVAGAFSHLIVEPEMLDQLGPAIASGKAMFLYGPPGNGKSVMGEGIGRVLGGDIYVPHAIDVDGQVVTMFDPVNHCPLDEQEDGNGEGSVITVPPRDRRWIRIRRPVVIVGGELTLDMLDLSFSPISKFHEAPIQLKANGGVFLVDDFGRQRMRPQDLLNRWIVPLESRVDYLTLHTGRKFQVPFDVLTVFATNLDPASLADEAFMRRIPYKILIGDPTIEQFTRIFEMACTRRGLKFHQVMVAYLQRRHYRPHGRRLRACHPRDLLDQVTALCRYRGVEPSISRELLDDACRAYFMGEAADEAAASRRRQLEVR